jgi:SAM-dependent methyltransferase
MSVDDAVFAQLFAGNDDPWAMHRRWYEQRKRALLLACLPRARYASVFEPGCANGATSLALAGRCERLLCCDTNERAVALTRRALADVAHARVEQWRLPAQFPAERFELIVLNELCYYLDADDLARLISACRHSLTADGQVVACHWRAAIEGCTLDGDAVHRQLAAELGMTSLVRHQEKDFVLGVWGCDSVSVAEGEGLR